MNARGEVRRVSAVTTAILVATLGLAGPAQADPDPATAGITQADPGPSSVDSAFDAGSSGEAGVQAAEYIPGKDVEVGNCKGWLNRRTTDGYVQALAQSWGNECYMILERKRLGAGGYDWTPVSDTRLVGIGYVTKTGWHWNGTDAGSRVCVVNATLGGTVKCGAGAW
ncbi:hypothetical protein [Streptosporangium longisporum]|uniref:Uncharacterized protein n=1 Tax=Streptosporangium longisporum TaxID=46187 RepID=A0ABN3XTZ5_9ACTN